MKPKDQQDWNRITMLALQKKMQNRDKVIEIPVELVVNVDNYIKSLELRLGD